MSVEKSNIFTKVQGIDSSSQGVYFKYNEINKGIKFLVKTGRFSGNRFLDLEPVAECICCEIANLLGIVNAKYTLSTANIELNNRLYSNTLICKSEWFLSKDDEFNSVKSLYLDTPRYETYDKIITDFPNQRINIDNMIVFDYIINNTDRHFRNFGFINNTYLSPLYDNGLSLGADIDDVVFIEEDMNDILMDCDYNKCFCNCNREQLKLIKQHSLDIDNLENNYQNILIKYEKYLKPYRIEFMNKLLKERINYVKGL